MKDLTLPGLVMSLEMLMAVVAVESHALAVEGIAAMATTVAMAAM